MSFTLRKEIERIKKRLLFLSANVEESVQKAIKAISTRDVQLAESVVEHDTIIDNLEVELEEECLKILALHQPVAIDLRFLIVVLKINNDLERIGDLAVNIAERAMQLDPSGLVPFPRHLQEMSETVTHMLHQCLDSLVRLDANLAHEVWKMDDIVDEAHRQIFAIIKQDICKHPQQFEDQISLVSVSRNLERIADLTTNIAEDVIYLLEGRVVRHRLEEGL